MRSAVLYLLFMLLLTVVLLIGLLYCGPVIIGIHSPISLLIFGIALWQAWKMTRASEMPVTGPYRVRGCAIHLKQDTPPAKRSGYNILPRFRMRWQADSGPFFSPKESESPKRPPSARSLSSILW